VPWGSTVSQSVSDLLTTLAEEADRQGEARPGGGVALRQVSLPLGWPAGAR
jgi:hypothetical protein